MKRSQRFGLVVASVFVLVAAVPSVAQACNEPNVVLGKTEAGPGEPVPYTVTDAQPGATYTISLDGQVVASGTSPSADGFSSTFSMPDVGTTSRTIEVKGLIEHEGSTWPRYRSIRFVAPVAAEQPAPSTPSDAGSPAPASSGSQTTGTSTPDYSPDRQASVVSEPGVMPPGHVPAPTSTRAKGGQSSRQAVQQGTPAEGARTSAPAFVSAPTAAEASAAAEPQRPARAGAADRGRGARVRAPVPVRRGVPVHAWGTTPAGARGGLTPSVALAIGLLVLAGLAGGGFGFARVRARRPAPWVPPAVAAEARARDLLIEAELQEIVAEARASEALGAPEPEAEPAEAVTQTASESRELVGAPGV